MATMRCMANPSSYPLSDYATPIPTGLEPDPDAEQSEGLTPERAARVNARLHELDLARQRAEAGSRAYQVR